MIQVLTEKYKKHIAWLLFLIFYGELAVTLYAGKQYTAKNKRTGLKPHLQNRTNTIKQSLHESNNLITPNESISASAITSEQKKDKVDIGGPGQPEMNTFRSVGADNMVNLFTGDFSYNIPLVDVGGYPVNLFYNAGITMDQEASWVGLGWNVNPGTISRNMRGLPDDYNGIDTIKKVQSIKPDLTIGVTGSTGGEVVGIPGLSGSISGGIYYNNRRGLGLEGGISGDFSIQKMLAIKTRDELTLKDTVKDVRMPGGSVSGGINLNSQGGMTLNGGFSIYKYNTEKHTRYGLGTSIGYSSRQGLTDLTISGEFTQYKKGSYNDDGSLAVKNSTPLRSGSISFARSSFTPSIRMPLTTFNQLYTVKLGREQQVFFKNGSISGYINETRIDETDTVQKKPAYGYMYYEKAAKDKNALMDFNRVNDGVYTYKTPVLSLPVYTYDVFTINGEGTGGNFRGYKGNMGYMRDHETKSKSGSFNLSLDLGAGGIFHGGTVIGGIYSPSHAGEWIYGNALRKTAAFKNTDSIYQGFYFKNPAEKAIIDEAYYAKMGTDQLVRPYLFGTNTASPGLASGFQLFNNERKVDGTIGVTSESYRQSRDKRTQVITYLTAEDAGMIGLDKFIYSYTENEFLPGSCPNPLIRTRFERYNPKEPTFYRKAHHISEVDVLEADGRRYVFGIPVYQIKQKEVTFGTENQPNNQLVSYNPNDEYPENSVKNKKGRDGFYQREEVGGYAHSFLLSGILSPDYVDVTGDGITDDDLGTAVKFNYSRVNKLTGVLSWLPFKWRMPADANQANYNEGLKADSKDDKGLYTYGEKELWYMHSIESKNMVATFRISARDDGRQVAGENGGLSGSMHRQKKLDRIDLYTKADYVKYGSNARPIKTVHFRYSYKLCKNFNLNGGVGEDGGKLTLDTLWFSYNGNERQKKNKYIFGYTETINDISANPDYNSTLTDRWSSYKPSLDNNPDNVGNNDFPYTVQDTTKSNAYAAAWTLDKILLPGGAMINVRYEADDYAYVQDKRASQMTKIAGFGISATSPPSDQLYTLNFSQIATPGSMDHRFVFFDAASPLKDQPEIASRYLQNFKQLLLKLWVRMPAANIGTGSVFEPVTIYGAIKGYGLVPDQNAPDGYDHSKFYVELEETRKGGSPIMETVMQFLKDHLPARAYPGYDVKDGNGLVQLARSVWGMVNNLKQGIQGFEKDLKLAGKCRDVQLSLAFARLNNPVFRKIGGGHRVKRIVITDNWEKMTRKNQTSGLHNSYYGQEYNYNTTEVLNGEEIIVSSGVASYEPGVGNEENPFREVLKYSERQFLGPTDHSNIELPIAETFFPSPSVGYSKVTVKSIHHNKEDKKIKSGIGLQQTEFFTTRDFPVISEFTSFDPQSRHHHKPPFLNQVFNFNKKDYLTLTQGFRIVLNDMNGKMKAQTSYPENDLKTPVNYTAYYYRIKPKGDTKFRLDNVLPVISGPDGKITNKTIGKEVEVMNDFREHLSYTFSRSIPLNAEFFTAGGFPIIIPTIFRMAFHDESRFRSATTLKIVNEYGILDSVVNIDKGSVVSTKNLIYDAESGDVLISRTNNEFNKPVYQFNYPAWWVNTGMEPAYRNVDLTYKNVLFRNGRIEESPQVNMKHFESGDEIYVLSSSPVAENPGCIAGGFPPVLPLNTEYMIWAVDIRKDLRNTEREFIFIDRYGNPYNAANVTIRVIRSGKRNLSGASVGSVVSLESPVRTVNNQLQVVLDNSTNVINTGAVEFKERWRANDMFYAKDTTINTTHLVPLKEITIPTVQTNGSYSIGYYRPGAKASDRHTAPFPNVDYFMARQLDKGKNKKDARQKSWILFDFDGFSENNTIVSAKLSLYSHKDDLHQITISGYNAGSHNSMNPHVSDPSHVNDFYLHRMLSTWPANNAYGTWYSLFDKQQTGSLNEVYVKGTPPWRSTKDYNYHYPTSTENRIDVTNIVKGMVRDKYDPTKLYATALKISMAHEGKEEARVCFYARDIVQGHLFYGPRIQIKYYNCSDTYTSGPSVECATTVTQKLCFSVFAKKQMNPYIEGVLGNWRAFRSYVYYGERRESDPSVPTDIRKDGIIKDFEPYWAFNTEQLAKTNSTKWVWNSEITQYNRKGAELENHDPLNRYNAGIYGYQESLPVAVINNSRLRLSAFDGFEDYFYKDDPCEPYCKPAKRHFNTGVTASILDTTESHTGKYSVKINANTNYNMDVKVSANDSISEPDIRIKLEKTPYQGIIKVTPKGIGLKGYYYNNPYLQLPVANTREDAYVNFVIRGKNNNGCKNNSSPLPAGVNCGDMSVKWQGKVQVTTTGNYEFASSWTNDACKIYVVDNTNTERLAYDAVLIGSTYNQIINPVALNAGQLHTIRIEYTQFGGVGEINIIWKKPGSTVFTTVDPKHFYPEGKENLADNSTKTETVYCEKPDTIQAINHHLIDSFNLVPLKKIVASVWVKKGGQDCKCTGYDNVNINVKNASDATIATMVPKERIIEGWQQFETIFTVPENGDKIKLEFNAPADVALFIDDLRLHPFNANMKSFVYDPVTLRLSAELDENNYASFYEYDDEGTLIRVKKETREGIKTISETRSALQKSISNL